MQLPTVLVLVLPALLAFLPATADALPNPYCTDVYGPGWIGVDVGDRYVCATATACNQGYAGVGSRGGETCLDVAPGCWGQAGYVGVQSSHGGACVNPQCSPGQPGVGVMTRNNPQCYSFGPVAPGPCPYGPTYFGASVGSINACVDPTGCGGLGRGVRINEGHTCVVLCSESYGPGYVGIGINSVHACAGLGVCSPGEVGAGVNGRAFCLPLSSADDGAEGHGTFPAFRLP